jgi:hypothetical protein
MFAFFKPENNNILWIKIMEVQQLKVVKTKGPGNVRGLVSNLGRYTEARLIVMTIAHMMQTILVVRMDNPTRPPKSLFEVEMRSRHSIIVSSFSSLRR